MGYRTTVQILLIIVSVVIITTYIRPTFDEMRTTQDETKEYREALDNAAKFNQELQRLVNQANSFSATQRRALERYLPNNVDAIAVMRDIETIVENNRMALQSLTTNESDASRAFVSAQGQPEETDTQPQATTFSVQVAGTYEQFKSLLQDFERNAYPLEAVSVHFSPGDGSVYSFSLELETYAFGSTESGVDNSNNAVQ